MAAVNEDVLAVSSNQGLLLLDVTRDPHVQRVIRTSRVYLGVCNGGKEQLVVGCAKDREGPASVDVISHGGQLLRTVINSERLTSLRSPSSFLGSPEAWLEQLEATFDTPKGLHWSLTSPSSLCVHEGHVMIGDFEARENGLHRVELSSGRVKDVYYPLLTAIERVQDLCMDAAGNLYLASGHFVMARSSIGQWRELLNGHDHGEGRWRGEEGGESGWLWPLAVSVTNTGLLVSWTDGHSTVVKTYDFI